MIFYVVVIQVSKVGLLLNDSNTDDTALYGVIEAGDNLLVLTFKLEKKDKKFEKTIKSFWDKKYVKSWDTLIV